MSSRSVDGTTVGGADANAATGVRLVGDLHIHLLLAFVFGVVFISVMLAFATQIPNPTQFQQWVFIVVVA